MGYSGEKAVPLDDGATGGANAPPEDTLRDKYYDYCSARVADVLLGMTPDEIFVAAEEAARARGLDGPLGYERMVRLATEHVSREIGLPSFATWCEAYAEDPETIEARLLGLWQSQTQPPEPNGPRSED